MSFGRKVAPVVSLALLLLGGTAIRGVVSDAPAFQPELNITSITGSSRLANTNEMYDHGAYLYQIAYGYLNADLWALAYSETLGARPTFEQAQENMQKAREFSRQSLMKDPANAHVWQVYAMSSFATGATEDAKTALQRSWALGPTNKELALSRLRLIDGLRLIVDDPAAFAEIYASDTAVLERNAPRFLNTLG